MKKLITAILMSVLCLSLMMCTASADWYDYIGFWEMQNVAFNGYTFGAASLDFNMQAAVHDDGMFIMIIDNEMSCGYINGYGGNYYIGEGADAINLSSDSQGRMHLSFTDDEGDKYDYRMRSASSPRLTNRQAAYVGDWKSTSSSASQVGTYTMTLYNDGFGVITADEGMMAVRMGTQGGRFALVDNEGLIMPVSEDSFGNITFTIIYTHTNDRVTVTMERN